MAVDMLVKLYDLPGEVPVLEQLKDQEISIKRALPPDKHRILEYVKTTFGAGWASECDVSFSNKPISCFIAVKEKQVVGFACYEATARGFFGPTGVTESLRGRGIGKALLLKCLLSMREEGYGYAIIGAVGDALEFYIKAANATPIEGSFPGVYSRLISK